MEDKVKVEDAERALLESEEKFRSASAAAQDAMIMVDSRGRISFWNTAAEKIFGYTSDEAYGQALHTLLAPERYREAYTAGFARFEATGQGDAIGKTLELSAIRKNGEEFPIEISLSSVRQGGKWTGIGIVRDITERKRVAAKLELFRTLVDNSSDAIEVLDPATLRFLDVNETDCRELGYSRDEMLSMTVHHIDPTVATESDSVVQRRLRETGSAVFEGVHIRKDGSRFPVEVSVQRVELDKPYLLAVVRNITERKLAENRALETLDHLNRANCELKVVNEQLMQTQSQLVQSEKMASIGQLAAGVAHEINNPVGFIHSNFGALEQYFAAIAMVLGEYEQAEAELSEAARERIRRAKEDMDFAYVLDDIGATLKESREGLIRLKKIVQDLKDFAHSDQEVVWRYEDLHKGLESTLNVVWNELKYKCTVEKLYGDLPPVECVISQINQVFMNLLVNAAQAIEERGVITLRSGTEGERVWIEVADTGKGIPPENLSRIFDPFFTTKPVGQGTGLGLSISFGIIQKHHGEIEVKSTVGTGTTFRIWLPVEQPKE
ncbi:MAG TPA: PAS domain S-box protein [Rhodocyclaceae bacterium]|nr:PAS domain S-box protein [Rhodocyclaceae bacterium]